MNMQFKEDSWCKACNTHLVSSFHLNRWSIFFLYFLPLAQPSTFVCFCETSCIELPVAYEIAQFCCHINEGVSVMVNCKDSTTQSCQSFVCLTVITMLPNCQRQPDPTIRSLLHPEENLLRSDIWQWQRFFMKYFRVLVMSRHVALAVFGTF